MANVSWRDEYLIGYTPVDKEHKKLFEIAGRAFSAVVGNEKIAKIKSIIQELISYTKIHFQHEEKYMQKINYIQLKEHQNLHKNIIISMNNFLKTVNQKEINELEKDLAHFIEQWFITHIVYEDKKISQWASKHPVKASCIEWKNIYTIGNETIDTEHKELFVLANEAFAHPKEKSKKVHMKESIIKLYAYMQKHFEDEETFMNSVQFNDLAEHKSLHVKIINSLNELLKNSASFDIDELEFALEEFIKIGLIDHIIKEDLKIRNWIKFLEEVKQAPQKLQDLS